MKNRVQGKAWIDYLETCREKSILFKFASFSINGNVRVDTSTSCHWCNDLERKIVFNFIRNNKDRFKKEDRTFIAKQKILMSEIF